MIHSPKCSCLSAYIQKYFLQGLFFPASTWASKQTNTNMLFFPLFCIFHRLPLLLSLQLPKRFLKLLLAITVYNVLDSSFIIEKLFQFSVTVLTNKSPISSISIITREHQIHIRSSKLPTFSSKCTCAFCRKIKCFRKSDNAGSSSWNKALILEVSTLITAFSWFIAGVCPPGYITCDNTVQSTLQIFLRSKDSTR